MRKIENKATAFSSIKNVFQQSV